MQYKNSGIGKSLIRKVKEAVEMKKDKPLVSTANVDLLVLTFYQSFELQIYEVKTDIVARGRGKLSKDIRELLIKDKLRRKQLLSWKL